MICILNHVVTCHIVHHILYDILTKLPFDSDIMTLLKQGSLSETEKSMEKKEKNQFMSVFKLIRRLLQKSREKVTKRKGLRLLTNDRIRLKIDDSDWIRRIIHRYHLQNNTHSVLDNQEILLRSC